MRNTFVVCFVVALFVFVACGTNTDVEVLAPTPDSQVTSTHEEFVAEGQFCVPVERDDVDFSVLNDVRALVEMKSVFTETAQDPELLLRGALEAIFNYLGVANHQIPQWANDIVDEEIARDKKRPDFSIINEVYQGLLLGPLRDSSYRDELIGASVIGIVGMRAESVRRGAVGAIGGDTLTPGEVNVVNVSVREVINALGENFRYSDLQDSTRLEELIEESVREAVGAFDEARFGGFVDEGLIEESIRVAFDDLVASVQNHQYSDLQDPSRREELIEASIRGVIDSLGDPFASYMTADAWKSGGASQSGRYRGIGIGISQNEKGIEISSVFDGTPAESAGLKASDVIVGINGFATENCTTSQFRLRVLSLENPILDLVVERESLTSTKKDVLFIQITKEEIKQLGLATYPGIELPDGRGNTIDNIPYRCNDDSLSADLPCPFVDGDEDGISDILYIRIHAFNEQMGADLEYFLQNTDLTPFKGAVIDVRSNPGGLVSTTIEAVDFFLPTNEIIYTKRNAKGLIETASRNEVTYLPPDTPLVILMNRDSYSGSELFASALQDHGRAVIVNRDDRSGGKGSVNQHFTLRMGDYGALYVSTDMWLTPNGDEIEAQDLDNDGHYEIGGVRPDIHVPWSDEDFTLNSQDVNYDPTLQAALDYIAANAVYLVQSD